MKKIVNFRPGKSIVFCLTHHWGPRSDAVSRFSSLDPSVLPFPSNTFGFFNRDQVVFREVADQKPVTGYCGNGRLGSGKHWLPSLISTYLLIQEQFHWSKMIFLLPCHVPLCIPYPSVQDGGFRPFSQWSIKCNWPFHKVWMWLLYWEIYGFFFHSHTSCEPVRHVGSPCPSLSGLLPAPLLHLKHPLPSYLRLPLGVSVRFNRPYLKPAACPSWSQQSGRMFNELRCEGKRANIIYFIVPPCSNSFHLLFYPLFTFAKSNPTCHSLSSSTFMSPLTLSQRSVSSSLLPYH